MKTKYTIKDIQHLINRYKYELAAKTEQLNELKEKKEKLEVIEFYLSKNICSGIDSKLIKRKDNLDLIVKLLILEQRINKLDRFDKDTAPNNLGLELSNFISFVNKEKGYKISFRDFLIKKYLVYDVFGTIPICNLIKQKEQNHEQTNNSRKTSCSKRN